MLKRWFSKKSNIFFALFLGFVIIQRLPMIKNNLSRQNELIKHRKVSVLNPEKYSTITFPPENSRAIAIFWATWCGPCKIEMERLKKSVESGAIPTDLIFAVNPYETNSEIKKFLAENRYPFTFIEAPELGQELGINVTPTTLFLDKGIITEMSSGMSIWGIWKAEFFL